MSDTLQRLAQSHMALLNPEEEDALLDEGGQSEFDPTEHILSEKTQSGQVSGELPYDNLFKDTEDCGQKVNEGVAKRVNSACTKSPAKAQFSSVQKYLRPENRDFFKAPRINPELWDDLQDKPRVFLPVVPE